MNAEVPLSVHPKDRAVLARIDAVLAEYEGTVDPADQELPPAASAAA